MTDKIVLMDGSRKVHARVPLVAIAEIARLRGVETEYQECPEFLEQFVRMAYKQERRQVNACTLTNALHQTPEMRERYNAGKVIVVDNDIYSGDENCNWFFGGFSECPGSLGYIVLSTARMQSENHMKDIVRHELGHMFGAPSKRRSNTYELYGLHCSNSGCVMQQKDTVAEAVEYAELRASRSSPNYCKQCEQDIQRFELK